MTLFTFTRRALLTGLLLLALPAGATEKDGLRNFSLINPPKPVPDISFRDEAGKVHQLSDYRGKVVILNIWATWCGPCVREMPSMDRLAATMDASQLAILPVSIDIGGLKDVTPFYETNRLQNLAALVDEEKSVMRQIKPRGLPYSLIINREGLEVGRALGEVDWDKPETIRMLEKVLRQK